MKGSYETRVKASVLQFNTSQALSSTCRVMNKEPPVRTEIIQRRCMMKNFNTMKKYARQKN